MTKSRQPTDRRAVAAAGATGAKGASGDGAAPEPAEPAGDAIPLAAGLWLAGDELSYRTSRSSGPGGQHVNKVETRVTLLFDLEASRSLSPEQKDLLRRRLPTRITKAGVLRIVAQKHRSQAANRQEARTRLARLVSEALKPRRRRKETRPSRASRRRRLEDKRRRGQLKGLRRRPDDG